MSGGEDRVRVSDRFDFSDEAWAGTESERGSDPRVKPRMTHLWLDPRVELIRKISQCFPFHCAVLL